MLKAVRSIGPSLLFLRELTSSTTPPRSLPFEMVLLLELYTKDQLEVWFKRVRDHQRVSHFVSPSLVPECPRFVIDFCNYYAPKLKGAGASSSREEPSLGTIAVEEDQTEEEADEFPLKLQEAIQSLSPESVRGLKLAFSGALNGTLHTKHHPKNILDSFLKCHNLTLEGSFEEKKTLILPFLTFVKVDFTTLTPERADQFWKELLG